MCFCFVLRDVSLPLKCLFSNVGSLRCCYHCWTSLYKDNRQWPWTAHFLLSFCLSKSAKIWFPIYFCIFTNYIVADLIHWSITKILLKWIEVFSLPQRQQMKNIVLQSRGILHWQYVKLMTMQSTGVRSQERIQCFMNLSHAWWKILFTLSHSFCFLYERKMTAAISKILRLDYWRSC